VLTAIEFRNPKPELRAQDWFFSYDCQRLGFSQMHHLGVICGHIEESRVMWPDNSAEARFAPLVNRSDP
ncbi:MAG TPA: hypothetical protein VM537_13170, partial [Anaerolineae bacterium]|nr:hypothetical protein [Anaerolineae bacterium]